MGWKTFKNEKKIVFVCIWILVHILSQKNLHVRNYAIKFEVKCKRNWKRGFSSSEDTGLQFRIILMYGELCFKKNMSFNSEKYGAWRPGKNNQLNKYRGNYWLGSSSIEELYRVQWITWIMSHFTQYLKNYDRSHGYHLEGAHKKAVF